VNLQKNPESRFRKVPAFNKSNGPSKWKWICNR